MTNIYQGEQFIDSRGKVDFYNTFDLSEIKRVYYITPEKGLVRAWQGHKAEKKWFLVVQGAFEVQVCKVEQWNPLLITKRELFNLTEDNRIILEVSGGSLNGFKSLEKYSKLMVFSNFSLEESKSDDIRFNINDLDWEL
jgi:dTDP-4-dehydrorhamnose 3,5-epimerase